MAPRFLRLDAYTQADRHEMVRRAEDAINAAGGWLVDANLVSNKSAVLRFELPLSAAEPFRAALLATSLKPSEESTAALASLCDDAARGPDPVEVMGMLTLTFIHNEPDLRRVVPAVPG